MQESRQPRVPLRQCAGCGAHFPKSALLRIVRTADGTAAPDFTGKAQSRGVYVCRDEKCIARVQKNGRIQKQLKCPLAKGAFDALPASKE